MGRLAWVAVLSWMLVLPGLARAGEPLVIRGQLDGGDHQTYRELPFAVPAGTTRITVEFDYTGRDQRTTVDLGLIGPDGFRGWSGGNKRAFTVSAYDATPSYLPGPLAAGEWRLLLGIPNVRAGTRASYVATIHLQAGDAHMADATRAPAWPAPVLADGEAWYRGDLHLHTGHSDASCDSQSGARVPCPAMLTLQAAAARGLDFVALTDHNTISHLHDIRALQPYFDRLLLIPGMEVTTFQGHANVFGVAASLGFRVGDTVPDWNALLAEADARGLPVSINHPALPSDERCMGCGWSPGAATDWARVAAIEIVNGGDADTPVSGIPYWEARLNEGWRITGVGGSDNHDATLDGSVIGRSRIGAPATLVRAAALSQAAILDGIRAGRVVVDVAGSPDRTLELHGRHGPQHAGMGDNLRLADGDEVAFELRVRNAAGAQVEIVVDGVATVPDDASRLDGDDAWLRWRWRSDGGRHWVRANVRDAGGALLLVGNPVYINF